MINSIVKIVELIVTFVIKILGIQSLFVSFNNFFRGLVTLCKRGWIYCCGHRANNFVGVPAQAVMCTLHRHVYPHFEKVKLFAKMRMACFDKNHLRPSLNFPIFLWMLVRACNFSRYGFLKKMQNAKCCGALSHLSWLLH